MLSLLISFAQTQANGHPVRSILILLLLLPLSYLVTNEFVRRKARIPGFCGPPGKPVFGNIPDIKYNAAEKVVAPNHMRTLTDWQKVPRVVENIWRCVPDPTRKHSCHCVQFGRVLSCSLWTFLTGSQLEASLLHFPQGAYHSRRQVLFDWTNSEQRCCLIQQEQPSERHHSARVSNVVAKVPRLR